MGNTLRRASVLETFQFGVETLDNPGARVPANLRLLATSIEADPETPTNDVEADGWKAPVDVTTQKVSTKATIKQTDLSLNDLIVLLACGLTNARPNSDGTTA